MKFPMTIPTAYGPPVIVHNDEELNAELRRRVNRMNVAEAQVKLSLVRLGRELLKLKERLPHGEFGRVVEAMGVHRRRAARAMEAARRAGPETAVKPSIPEGK